MNVEQAMLIKNKINRKALLNSPLGESQISNLWV